MEKGKRKGISLQLGQGGILAQPSADARAGGLAWPASRGQCGDGAVGTGPHVRGRRGVTASGGGGGAVHDDENRRPVKFRDDSSPVTRFCVDGMVARHERR
jgi:hypothetical protein